MNINLIKASIIMLSLEDRTAIDRRLLMDNPDFVGLFKNLLNEDKLDMEQITDILADYVANHY
jgi:hypothetical protein